MICRRLSGLKGDFGQAVLGTAGKPVGTGSEMGLVKIHQKSTRAEALAHSVAASITL